MNSVTGSRSYPFVGEGVEVKKQKKCELNRDDLIEAFKRLPDYKPSEEGFKRSKDRYPNILPNSATRVSLKKVSFEEDAYINANKVLEDSLIATQGPLDETVSDFFQMVYETNAAAIVIVSNPIERGTVKFTEYWDDRYSASFGTHEVEVSIPRAVLHEQDGLTEKIVSRELSLEKYLEDEEEESEENIRKVQLFSVENWPDRGVVQKETLAALVQNLHKFMEGNGKDRTIICHCSAGVGRTGTALAVYHIYKRMIDGEKYEHSSLFDAVSEMRSEEKGRHPWMVQTEEQYILAHETLEYLAGQIDTDTD